MCRVCCLCVLCVCFGACPFMLMCFVVHVHVCCGECPVLIVVLWLASVLVDVRCGWRLCLLMCVVIGVCACLCVFWWVSALVDVFCGAC